jgi:hypothetical protein
VAWEFFGSEEAREAVRKKVQALYPENEVEEFTGIFFDRIQEWRRQESDRPETLRASTAGVREGK